MKNVHLEVCAIEALDFAIVSMDSARVTAWVVREDEVIVLILILCGMVRVLFIRQNDFLDGSNNKIYNITKPTSDNIACTNSNILCHAA